ncbi:unnamed protein product [Gordionus sp. m RMFG-2023]
MPKNIKFEPISLSLNPETLVITSNLQCDILEKAFERYANIMFSDENYHIDPELPQIAKLNLIIRSKICESYPPPNMDEAYELYFKKYFYDPKRNDMQSPDLNTIQNQIYRDREETLSDISIYDVYEARIISQTIWGALRGLETFSQMITYTNNNTYVMNKQTIYDNPRFKHRGLLVDTARHFIPVFILKKILDGMSYNKMNVFHWHIVDDQAFPYESITFPELSKKGAYTPAHTYKQDDVADIIKYARFRGIRVIPEFDTPGHTFSWGKSHPEIMTSCYGDGRNPNTPRLPYHRSRENLDPLSPITYNFIERLFKEIFRIFPDPYFHAGMDEAFPACWRSNPYINNLTSNTYYDPYKIAFDYYINRTVNIINKYHKNIIVWEDPVEDNINLPENITLQVWKNWGFEVSLTHKIQQYALLGHKLIISAPWYLDEEYRKEDWKRFYTYEPEMSMDLESFLTSPIIGGEACMWSEYIDGSSILETIWPRASAVAERLWSPRGVNNIDNAELRLGEQRCRMTRRGIDVRPIKPGFCGKYDYGLMPDSTTPDNIAGNQWILLPS